MHYWTKRLFALAAPLLLTGCLWGPGKFNSGLTLRKDGSFVLDYHGEMVLQIPADEAIGGPWKAEMARCFQGMPNKTRTQAVVVEPGAEAAKQRPCTAAEIEAQKSDYEQDAARKRKQAESMAKLFGLPGLDDESNRAFAAKLMKYAGWRSVTYRGKGVFDVDYHFAGSAKQDFLFPALPDNDLLIPFVAIRRRADGAVLVTAPAFTGGAGPLASRIPEAMSGDTKTDIVSHADGRFTVITDGEILTNNSEDGPSTHPLGRQVHWDVNSTSRKIPETLIRL
jgi:hypothetical protein